MLLYNPFDQTSHTTVVSMYQNTASPSPSGDLRTLTFTYITHDTSLYRISVYPNTLFDGFIHRTSIRSRRLDEQPGFLEVHLQGALRIIGPEEPKPRLDRNTKTTVDRTSNSRNP